MSDRNTLRRTGIANLPLPATALPTAAKTASPYPVDRQTYDQSIELLRKAINKTKLGIREKNEAMSRLNKMER